MPNRTLKVTSPYSGQVVAEVPYDTAASTEEKVLRAQTATLAWRKRPLAERKAAVESALELFRRDKERIARDVTNQMGKPIGQALREVDTLLDRATHLLSIADESLAPDILPPKEGFVRRIEHVPVGVILEIAPWNYPLLIPVNVVVAGLLSGNSVLLKHSPETPLTGQLFEQAFGALEVPHLVQNLVLDPPEIAPLLQDRRIGYIAFTGSVKSGLDIYHKASTRVVDVALELGGKDPAYVAADADLGHAVDTIVDGACYNAGQSCCAIERAYVHETVYEEFVSRADALMKAYKLGDPMDESTSLGPLAKRNQPRFLADQVADAVKRGARLVSGGHAPEGSGWFFEATLLRDVPQEASVMQAESFGPVLPVRKVSSDEEALRLMNDSELGLTAAVFTKDPARAERMGAELDAGTVFQNRCDYLDPALPWTGHKDSGLGSSLTKYGFHCLTQRKSIHYKQVL